MELTEKLLLRHVRYESPDMHHWYLGKYLSFCSSLEGVSKLFLMCMDTSFKIIFRGKSGVAPRSHDLKITFQNYNRLHWHARLLSKFILCTLSAHQRGTVTICTNCVRDCEAVNDKLQERELKQQTSRFSENVNPQCPQRSHHPHLHQAHQPHCHDQSLQQAQHHHHHPHTSRHHYPHHHIAPPHLPH